LTEIPGVGEKTASKLLTSFGSVKKIREASEEDLISVVGKAATALILKWINS